MFVQREKAVGVFTVQINEIHPLKLVVGSPHQMTKNILQNKINGSGSGGGVVTSDTRGPQFESSFWQNLRKKRPGTTK